jgi:hypothetical protein
MSIRNPRNGTSMSLYYELLGKSFIPAFSAVSTLPVGCVVVCVNKWAQVP